MLFAGQSISVIGRQITLVAVPYQVYVLTGSSLAVALLGLVQIVPLVGVGLYAGALADLHDRRRVLLLSQILLAPTSLALAVLALSSHTPLWPLYVITALAAGFTALEQPTRQATIPGWCRAASWLLRCRSTRSSFNSARWPALWPAGWSSRPPD